MREREEERLVGDFDLVISVAVVVGEISPNFTIPLFRYKSNGIEDLGI